MEARALYLQLGRLIEATPPIPAVGQSQNEMARWLGQAYALVRETGDISDMTAMKAASEGVFGRFSQYSLDQVLVILNRALAVAELKIPASAQGAFIPASQPFDALAAVSKILSAGKNDLLVVDPYMDEKALTDFLPVAGEGVSIRLLADEKTHKPSLRPSVSAWVRQYGSKRPLETRLTAPRILHDRLIIVDGTTVYTLTQSLNAFAQRSPATIVRVDGETAAMKTAAYEAMWVAAKPI